MIVLKFMSHSGRCDFDCHYEKTEDAEAQFLAVEGALRRTRPDSFIIPVLVRDGGGTCVMINALQYTVMMCDLEVQVKAEVERKRAVKEANMKFGDKEQVGFQK